MCDKELLLGYLYDDLSASDRQSFDRHLASCADCREDIASLRGTRTHLLSWAPPEPDLGFHIVRSAQGARDVAASRWWRPTPAWGFAAAAMLTLAVSAAVANVEVRAGTDGIVVRTGWNRGATAAGGQDAAADASVAKLERVEARMKELEGQLAARQATPAQVPASVGGRMSDAEIVRFVRQTVGDSEQRQQGVLAHQILQVNRDTERARLADIDRLLVAVRQLQGNNFETSQRTSALEQFVRVGMQR